MSKVKPLFLDDGNLRQMSPGFTIDPTMFNGSTVGRFNSQNPYKARDVVLHDVGQGLAFYEAKGDLYPKAFYSGDWEPVGTAITGSQGDQGLDGSPGSDAKFLVVTADSHVFRYGSDGGLRNPEQITVTANMQNLGDGVLTWTARGAGVDRSGLVDLFPSEATPCVVLGNQLIIPGGFFTSFIDSNSSHWDDPVLTLTASQGTYQDTFRVLKLKDGENALLAFLTNSNHTTSTGEKVYVDSSGNGVADSPIVSGDSLAPAGGDFKVYRGFLELTPANSPVSYEVGAITPAGGASVSIDSGGVYTVASVSAETVTVVLRATVDGETAETIYTHALAFQGRDGTSFLSGASAPTPNDGLEGDFWLDTSSLSLYGPKRGATTASSVSVTGAPAAAAAANTQYAPDGGTSDGVATYASGSVTIARYQGTGLWSTKSAWRIYDGLSLLVESNLVYPATIPDPWDASWNSSGGPNILITEVEYPQWPTPGINLTGAGVDTDGDGLVDAMVANGFLGHNRTIDRSLSCAATVNGLMIGEVTIADPSVFTIAEGGIIIIVGEQIGSAITPDSLGEFLSPLAISGVWGDVANKPAGFPPEPHTQSVDSITGLQAALTELQRVASQNRVFVSDEPPPRPGTEGDETRVGDIWVQWDPNE